MAPIRSTGIARLFTENGKYVAAVALGAIFFSTLFWLVPRPLGFVLATAGAVVVGWFLKLLLDALYARPRRKAPLAITVATREVSYMHASSTPQSFVLEREPDSVPPAPPEWEEDRSPWAYSLGAIDANSTEVQVVIEANEAGAVIVEDLKVRVSSRESPTSGTHLQQLGGDLVDVRYVDISLDHAPPRLTLGSGYTEGAGRWDFPLTVSDQSPEVLHLFAHTSKHCCLWEAELHYVSKGSRHVAKINNHGAPFRTTSTQNAKDYVLLPDGSLTPRDSLFPN